MSTQIPDDIDALLAAARDLPAPPAGHEDAILARLESTLGLPPDPSGPSGGAGGGGPGASAASGGKLLAAAIKPLALLLFGAGALVVWVRPPAAPAQHPAAPVVLPAPAPVQVPAPVVEAVVGAAVAAPAPAALVTKPRDTAPRRASSPQAPAEQAPPTTTPDEGAERQLLRQAHASFRAGDHPACLATLGEHARTWPAGKLAEERDALMVQALAGTGNATAAEAAAQAFLERYPRSLFRHNVSSATRR